MSVEGVCGGLRIYSQSRRFLEIPSGEVCVTVL